MAAIVWRGGDAAIEAPLLEAVDRVVAYGGAEALADLRRRAGDRVIAFGPKASVALVATPTSRSESVAAALARDVALFDQRGCLSLQAIYTDGDADALAAALARRARPSGATLAARRAVDRPRLAALRLVREEAAFLGVDGRSTHRSTAATVIVDRRALFLPSPGHRTVRVHPVADLDRAIAILRPHGARLQGAAVAGDERAR